MRPGQRRTLYAIGLKLASVALFVVMQALVKYTAERVPPGEAVFFRSFFALPVILAWIAFRGQLALGLLPKAPLGHFWRGLMGTLSMGLGFAALAYLPLPEVTAIGFAAPLLVVVFAAMYLDERVPQLNWLAVLLGLGGVLIVLYPRFTVFDRTTSGHAELLGVSLVLGCAVFAALAQTVVRKLLATDRTPIIVLWFSVTATSLSLLTLPVLLRVPPFCTRMRVCLLGSGAVSYTLQAGALDATTLTLVVLTSPGVAQWSEGASSPSLGNQDGTIEVLAAQSADWQTVTATLTRDANYLTADNVFALAFYPILEQAV